MTLQERQKKEIKALQMEIADTWVTDLDALLKALEEVQSDPETYFKNIDEEE